MYRGVKPQATPHDRMLTPPAIARLLGISQDKVLGWIRSGELRAVDVADRASRAPRYRIAREWLDELLRDRAVTWKGKSDEA